MTAATDLSASERGRNAQRVSETPRIATPIQPDAVIVHGNFCGLGNRGMNRKPVDALDDACRKHDSCYRKNGQPPPCGCHERLRQDAEAIEKDGDEPPHVQIMAAFVAFASDLMDCSPFFPSDAAPARGQEGRGHNARRSGADARAEAPRSQKAPRKSRSKAERSERP